MQVPRLLPLIAVQKLDRIDDGSSSATTFLARSDSEGVHRVGGGLGSSVLSDSAVALVLRAANGFAPVLVGNLTYHRKLRRMRHHGLMELREGLSIDDARLAEFAAQHGIRRLALFGSALRPDFASNSDIDLLVEFLPGRTPGLLRLAAMELELEAELGYPVELRTYEDLSTYFRHQVAATSRPLYAA